jgi:hypothetical protein
MYSHEVKGEPVALPTTHIVEAYGLGKCPKLVDQVESPDLAVRQSALRVLCEEFRNPANIAGCAQAGVFTLLPAFVLDEDLITRKRASEALALASRDYNGRAAMLSESFAQTVQPALDDASQDVRASIYAALEGASALPAGVRALVQAEYPAKLVAKVSSEADPALRTVVLAVLYNVLRDRDGLQAALDAGAVEACIALLPYSAATPGELQQQQLQRALQAAACALLQALCFSEMGKIVAIQGDAVARLAELITHCTCGDVHSAALGTLMIITSVDAGKRAFLQTGAVPLAVAALAGGSQELAKLNALKLIASIAAHPGTSYCFLYYK